MDPAVVYCSRDCQKADWRAGHKEVCVALLSQILSAMEVALFGSSPTLCTDAERFFSISRVFHPTPEVCGKSIAQRTSELLQAVYMPPIVEFAKPAGPRFAAFAPMMCLGVFASVSLAALAVTRYLLCVEQGGNAPPGALDAGNLPTELKALSYIEFACVAPVIANHVRPVALGQPATPPEKHLSRAPKFLPRRPADVVAAGPVFVATLNADEPSRGGSSPQRCSINVAPVIADGSFRMDAARLLHSVPVLVERSATEIPGGQVRVECHASLLPHSVASSALHS
jgi:hypothetical protein